MKTHFTRKNLITIGIIYFYLVLVLFSAMCLDANGIFVKDNPIASMGDAFNFIKVNGSINFYILLACFLIYVLLFSASLIYEIRLAKYYEEKALSKKWLLVYLITFIICLVLCFGIGLCAQYPYVGEIIKNNFILLGESILIGLILFIILGSFIFAICLLIINFKNIDKPFRFFGSRTKEVEESEARAIKEEEDRLTDQGNLAASFGESNIETSSNLNSAISAISGVSGNNNTEEKVLKDKEIVFPGLSSIDVINEAYREKDFDDENITLKDLATNFRLYLAKKEKLYFDITTIRTFISALSSSRLIILEGLSGTGKSSLARYFSEYIGEESYFEAVQATWRDRTSLLGFYNDFSKTYNETEFLKRMYDATYKLNQVNIMVLDEVNISRVEYYFADFLSILEYPIEKWKLKIMQLPYDFVAPNHLEDGILNIPYNTWFIATANKDDSTFTITDKVYDRAITISFDDQNIPFEVNEEVTNINLSYSKLMSLFNEAINNKEFRLNEEDYLKFRSLINFTYENFDITIGNRIMHQLETFVPTFISTGGNKIEALDFMFSRKVINKLEGRFEDYIKDGLNKLKVLINKTYGENTFKETFKEINRLIRKL